ncbi:hypothetical protein [Amycolatopsis sp. CA-230715]|uniref:hypothetical protein n=1 Tax=Amycolatopsis sp. CA-230715 TaxID=2745196 RepID=UPI001C00E96F|nr:hypothetical protein [Amycolatopsis sp. CA-230715]QWF76677.1 hypothetical protein HUW46_00053 [Amycolatopsis sp. CA-230715]
MERTTEWLSDEDVLERTGFLHLMFANERHSLGEALDNLLAGLDDLVTITERHTYEHDRGRSASVAHARRFRDTTLHQLTAAYEHHPDCPWR